MYTLVIITSCCYVVLKWTLCVSECDMTLYTGRFQRSSVSDVWFADVDQMWLEFVIAGSSATSERSSRRRTVPLVDNFPLMAWMSRLTTDDEHVVTKTTIHPTSDSPASQTFCMLARVGTRDIKAQVWLELLSSYERFGEIEMWRVTLNAGSHHQQKTGEVACS